MFYVVMHVFVSRRHKIWLEDNRRNSLLRTTHYLAIRVVVAICTLWLLTSGWNLIIAARQPLCLPGSTEGAAWQVGLTCVAGRFSAAMSIVAL